MLKGIGVDIVLTERFIPWISNESLLYRFFHPLELQAIQNVSPEKASQMLAARFAAKEALGKALGTGLRGMTLRHISIHTTVSGKPSIHLEGDAQKAFEQSGAITIHVSISHEKNMAVAFVAIE